MVRRGFFMGAAAIGATMMFVSAASALPQVDPKLQANKFNSKLVQAFAECDPAGSSVTSLPNGLLGCRDGELAGYAFNLGKLIVKHKVFPSTRPNIILTMKSSGTQQKKDSGIRALAGKNLRLRLTLRISEVLTETFGDQSAPLEPNDQVTYADQVVICPAVAVPANGNVVHKFNLVTCIKEDSTTIPNAVLANSTNKAIVSAEVEDADTSLAIAVPGVRKK